MYEQESHAMQGMIEKEMGRQVLKWASGLTPDWKTFTENKSVSILNEIVEIIQGAEAYPDDQQLVEDIMSVLHKNGISTGVCHDY